MISGRVFFIWLCTKHRLIFTHRHRFASSAQRFDKDRLRLFIKASLPARGVTISGDDRRFACTFAAPTAATSVSAAGPRAGSTRGRVLFYFFQSLFSTQPIQKEKALKAILQSMPLLCMRYCPPYQRPEEPPPPKPPPPPEKPPPPKPPPPRNPPPKPGIINILPPLKTANAIMAHIIKSAEPPG